MGEATYGTLMKTPLTLRHDAHDLFTLPSPLDTNLEGFAAAFSSWFLYRPARTLLDAGEGIASRLGNRIYIPDAMFLTHAHFDHISGLVSFLLARTSARGDALKGITIYYPKAAERAFGNLRQYVDTVVRHHAYELAWKSVEAGERIPVRHWIVEPFPTKHSIPSLGYRFLEARERLAPEHRGKSQEQIVALKKGGNNLTETYEHVVLAFTGDTGPGIDPALIADADVLLHDCTFLDAKDREGLDHATAEEAMTFARDTRVKTLVLYHVSQRYFYRDIVRTIPEVHKRTGYQGHVAVVAGYTHPNGFY